jgi:hypothetical protein
LAGEEKIVLPDGGGAEGVRLDDVGAGLEIAGVNLFDHLWLGELEELEVAFEIFRRVPGEARTAKLFLREFVLLHHGPHRAIENNDASAEQVGEWVVENGVHGGAAI